MPELLRTLVGRIREYAGDRRHMPRHQVRLEVTVAPDTTGKTNDRHPASLQGHTRDISDNGLGLIVPVIRIGERYLAGENCRLAVLLELPRGVIYLRATAVRYEPLENQPDRGYLIGARITEMSDEHRELFMAYLQDELDQ